MDLIPRFSRLMAEALHCGSTPAGLELPLAEVHERLKLLADEERALPLPEPDVSAAIAGLPLTEETSSPGDAAQRLRLACENARFAVYAWVDEQILQSSRLDATDWLGYSLQYHYFDTTDAGRDFFARLRTLAGSAVPFVDNAAPEAADGPADNGPQNLEAVLLHGGDELTLATIRVYALCLLYGFTGMLHDFPEALTRYRKAAYLLLRHGGEATAQPSGPARAGESRVAEVLEKAAYVLVPPLVVLLFGALCAAELANIPLPRF